MKLIKEYLSDSRDAIMPSDEEIKECIEIAHKENCIVKLIIYPYSTWRERYIQENDTFESVKDGLLKIYGTSDKNKNKR